MDGFKHPNGVFVQEKVKFCQIDIEIHGSDLKPAKINFGKFFMDLIRNTTFIPVHAEFFLRDHRKVTFIDGSGVDECDNIFKFSAYF